MWHRNCGRWFTSLFRLPRNASRWHGFNSCFYPQDTISTTHDMTLTNAALLSSDPVFPFELEREIFERAESEHHLCATTLVLVAHRVRQWIEPKIYKIVMYAGSSQRYRYPPMHLHDKLVPRFSQWKQYAHHAKHVLLQDMEGQDAAEILSLCTNVEDLALWVLSDIGDQLPSVISSLPMKRLSIDVQALLTPSPSPLTQSEFKFDETLFTNLTHLDIISGEEWPWNNWKRLALIPRLTHLALNGEIRTEFMRGVLDECLALEVLVVLASVIDLNLQSQIGGLQDDRLVRMDRIEDPIGHWAAGARGEEDFWITAERVVKSRRQV
ncbi:hypothetical protein B0H34DRAFT_184801 [Crassisporium funariophilum]|nr:hypothetical protein B0H34DRAFT_184801 [Crassisporium funariophilum]